MTREAFLRRYRRTGLQGDESNDCMRLDLDSPLRAERVRAPEDAKRAVWGHDAAPRLIELLITKEKGARS